MKQRMTAMECFLANKFDRVVITSVGRGSRSNKPWAIGTITYKRPGIDTVTPVTEEFGFELPEKKEK